MHDDMIKELAGDELESVNGGMMDTSKFKSESLWDTIMKIIKDLTVPTALPGGTHQR